MDSTILRAKPKQTSFLLSFRQPETKHFQGSLFHSWLYSYHVEEESSLPDPGFTPYYDQAFFQIIRDIKKNSPLNPIHISVKDWYKVLVEKNVTRRDIDEEGRSELIPCKVEEKHPDIAWSESYRLCRLKGLNPSTKSFLFKLVHLLLPSKERVHHLTPTASPLCCCESGQQETYFHLFYDCSMNREAGEAVLRVVKAYARNLTMEKSLRMEFECDEPFMLPSVSTLATGLLFIWENRKIKKSTTLPMMRAELEAAVSIKRRSRLKKVKEAGQIMQNMIDNFF